MAELMGAVASGISIAALTVQVGKSLIKLRCFWNSIEEVPEDIALLIEEIEDLSQLLLEIEESYDHARSLNIALDSISSERCLVLCRKSALRLKALTDTLVLDTEKQSSFRKKLKCARIVLQKDRVEKYRRQLERDLTRLSLSFSSRTRILQLKQFELTMTQISNMALVQFGTSEATVCPSLGNTRQIGSNLGANASEELHSATSSQPKCRHTVVPCTHNQKSNVQEWFQYCLGVSSYRFGCGKLASNNRKARQRAIFVARYQAPIWLFNMALEARVNQQGLACGIQFCVYNVLPPESPIFAFARENNLEGLRELFSRKKASPYDRDSGFGYTALHYAAERGNLAICKLLLNEGADPNAEMVSPLSRPWNAIQCTVWYQKRDNTAPILDTMRLLADAGADLPSEDIVVFNGRPEDFCWLRDRYIPTYTNLPLEQRVDTAMHIIGNNKVNLLWIALGCDNLRAEMFQIRDSGGHTLIHYLARRFAFARMDRDAQADWKALIRKSLELSINLHEVDDDGFTPLFIVVNQRTHFKVIDAVLKMWLEMLVQCGINLNTYGQTESLLHKNMKSRFQAVNAPLRLVRSHRQQPVHEPLIIGFHYGLSPNEWYIWWSEESDKFAGEFWSMIERDEEHEFERLSVPGAWIDSL